MSKNVQHLASVATPAIGGVSVQRHVLELEATRMMHLCRRVSYRVRQWFKLMPEERVAQRWDHENHQYQTVMERYQDESGQWQTRPLTEPMLPDRDLVEVMNWYGKSILGLLREQRERAKMTGGKGALAIDDATLESELEMLAMERLREMPAEELKRLIQSRAIDAGAVDANEQPPTVFDDEV